jgi:hypothetical protein
MVNADLSPAINVAQRLKNQLDAIDAKLAEDNAKLAVAAKDHAAKNQAREQAWQRAITEIQAGMGIDPNTIDYVEHMASVQALIAAASDANQDAEASRKVLVSLQKAVADGEAARTVNGEEHDVANRKRISVWRQVISQIESGF